MYHILKNARYRKMESIFVIKKKMKLLQKASILRTVLKKHFKEQF